MFNNMQYFDKVLNDFKTDGVRKLKSVLKINADFITAAEKSKEVFLKFNGKIPTKRLNNALYTIDPNFQYLKENFNYSKFIYNPGYCFYNIYIFSGEKIERINAADIINKIDEAIKRVKTESDRIKNDIKNIKSKLKKLYTAADQYNKIIDEMDVYTLEQLNIKIRRIY